MYKRDVGDWYFALKNMMLSQKRPNEFEECTRAISSFGKTVFLSHEEAEQALKEVGRMDEYINKLGAEAFYQNFMKLLAQETEKHTGAVEVMVDKAVETGLNMMIKAVRQIPAADVAPVVHGHWKDIGTGHKECSECGESYCGILHYAPMNYCPSCGALMDGQTSPRPAHGPETESEVQP